MLAVVGVVLPTSSGGGRRCRASVMTDKLNRAATVKMLHRAVCAGEREGEVTHPTREEHEQWRQPLEEPWQHETLSASLDRSHHARRRQRRRERRQ